MQVLQMILSEQAIYVDDAKIGSDVICSIDVTMCQ